MENKIAQLHSTFSINGEISNDDTRFLQITIDVLHLGLNRNGSVFTKDVVDSCVDSIKNTPVLGFINKGNKYIEPDFEGHEHTVTRTENGIEEIYAGHAYGVIPESCNPRWVMKVCSDGQEREFLQVDALLWEKFNDASDIFYRDVEKNQSMELEISSVDGYEDEDGIFYFEKFRFDGCCVLGDDVLPAMVDANLKLKEVQFAADEFIKNIQGELNDKFTIFTALVNEKNSQGGVVNMPNTDLEQVVENQPQIEDVQSEDVEFEVEVETEVETEVEVEDVEPEVETDVVEPEVTETEVVEEVVEQEAVEYEATDEVAEEVAESEVIENDGNESEEAGTDEETVDFQSKLVEMEAEIESIKADYNNIKVEYDAVKSAYETIKAEYDEIKPKYDAFVQAEMQREAEEIEAKKDAAFAEYEIDLSENAEFIALKERKSEMSLDDIEKECAFLYVKVMRSKNSNFSQSETASATVEIVEDVEEEAAGYFSNRYGFIPTKR